MITILLSYYEKYHSTKTHMRNEFSLIASLRKHQSYELFPLLLTATATDTTTDDSIN